MDTQSSSGGQTNCIYGAGSILRATLGRRLQVESRPWHITGSVEMQTEWATGGLKSLRYF